MAEVLLANQEEVPWSVVVHHTTTAGGGERSRIIKDDAIGVNNSISSGGGDRIGGPVRRNVRRLNDALASVNDRIIRAVSGHGWDVCLLDSRFANVGHTKVSGDAGGHRWEVDRLYGTISNSDFGHSGVRYLMNGCLDHTMRVKNSRDVGGHSRDTKRVDKVISRNIFGFAGVVCLISGHLVTAR